ncbi:MAG: 30S ribosomal protein S2 [Rickettsiales bacterium]|jgi:small subunit ribosomal protein S2|nr:30S ribosomal protein S2 [Rickettsiales bacterium]
MRKLPSITISELIAAGVHFGHKTMRWNPKMSSYLYGIKDGIHIIDLQQTLPLLHVALEKLYDVAKNNGRILFVGTKMQASDIVAEEAKRCGQYYINHRWLGGTLTNWATINRSIKKLGDLEKSLVDADSEEETSNKLKFNKKERLDITRKIEKLEKSLGGIREMGGVPDLIFIIDTNMEDLAVQEATKLGIPVIAILDSNSNPDNITYPIPGNDDATRSLKLYCRLVTDAILYGIQESLINSGVDMGEAADLSDVLQLNKAEASVEEKTVEKKPAARKASAKTEEKVVEKKAAAKKAPAKKKEV